MVKTVMFLMSLIVMTQAAFAQGAGVGAWENSRYTMLEWIEDQQGLDWYYNWRTSQMWHPGNPRRSVEFVLMIHGADDVHSQIQSSRRARTLLAFNEPDANTGSHQAEMTVAQAISYWPTLEARGLRLSSPATTQVDTVQLASSGLNLLKSAEPRTAATRPTRSAVGSGSYICSPAGFGQPSRCYSNLNASRVFGT
jgi:hypothetical protein